ncbi:MAG: prenyltransferase [Bacteroidales bacterium]|nr:prenyltransferase [Bacteroidales bacterium]
MKKHSLKEWIATTRYWSFSVSAFPVLAAAAYLTVSYGITGINWIYVLLAVIGVVVLHAAGNLLSDVGDFRSGADSKDSFAVPNLVQHIFEPKEYLALSFTLFGIGAAIGLVLTWLCGIPLLLIGVIGVVLTMLYSQGKNYYLGDAIIFIVFGILILLGTAYVAVGKICYDTLLLSLPIGLITLSVLHANNIVDIKTDAAAGLKTWAMAMGESTAVKVYVIYQIVPFLSVIICVLLGLFPWTALLSLLAVIPAISNIKKALTYKENGRNALIGLDLLSAKLQLIFSLTLTIGLLLAALL